MTEKSPLEKLTEAIQEFVVATKEEPVLLQSAVVVYEGLTYGEDSSEPSYSIDYSIAGISGSIASAVGLLVLGIDEIKKDLDDEDYE